MYAGPRAGMATHLLCLFYGESQDNLKANIVDTASPAMRIEKYCVFYGDKSRFFFYAMLGAAEVDSGRLF